ncbi:MAG: hypothetical protein IKQ91_08840 [Oscillospiraceae bacterium]|nr:hypothetical protein [Oscillospiraceae bacterium]
MMQQRKTIRHCAAGVLLCMLPVLCLTAGCGAADSVQSETESVISEASAEPAAEDNLLFCVDLEHPDDADRDTRATVFLFFVEQDGNVLTTQYLNQEGYDFFGKKARRDPDIFNHADPPEQLGSLSEDELNRLKEAVSQISPDAERYVRGSDEPAPDVQEMYELVYQCYIPDSPTTYTALAWGPEKGDSIRTKDPNALAAISIIDENALFQQWRQAHE